MYMQTTFSNKEFNFYTITNGQRRFISDNTIPHKKDARNWTEKSTHTQAPSVNFFQLDWIFLKNSNEAWQIKCLREGLTYFLEARECRQLFCKFSKKCDKKAFCATFPILAECCNCSHIYWLTLGFKKNSF